MDGHGVERVVDPEGDEEALEGGGEEKKGRKVGSGRGSLLYVLNCMNRPGHSTR